MSIIKYLLFFPLFIYGQILEYELAHSWSIYDIQDIYNLSNLPSYVGDVNYAVDAYKVNYLSPNENGDLVETSGVIFLPINQICEAPILSWQHGTIVSDANAPSENIENQLIGIISASHGYIVVMSDYLGLGSGEGFHNYCHTETEASAVIDLILLSEDFANSNAVQTNGQLFLMGYSQGGHATMAAVKEIESNWSNTLNITASCPMAGPYSMSEAQAEMIYSVYPNPGYFPYVIFAYQNVYSNLYTNISDVLKPGFAELFDMYDGTYSMNDINEEILSIATETYGINSEDFTPLDMIQEDYYNAYQNNEDHPFQIALKENDLLDFIPNSPMRLIHCNGDNDVSYTNSVMAFEAFSPFVSQELVLLDGGGFSHNECASTAIISAKLFFDSKAEFCNNTFINDQKLTKELITVIDILGRPIQRDVAKYKFIIQVFGDGSTKKMIQF